MLVSAAYILKQPQTIINTFQEIINRYSNHETRIRYYTKKKHSENNTVLRNWKYSSRNAKSNGKSRSWKKFFKKINREIAKKSLN